MKRHALWIIWLLVIVALMTLLAVQVVVDNKPAKPSPAKEMKISKVDGMVNDGIVCQVVWFETNKPGNSVSSAYKQDNQIWFMIKVDNRMISCVLDIDQKGVNYK